MSTEMSLHSTTVNPIVAAATEYIMRKERMVHPSGSFDHKGRWTPSDSEWQSCCHAIRTPSTAYPYSLMTHCRTLEHICRLYDVQMADVKRLLPGLTKRSEPTREGGDSYYKAVAVVGDRYLSIYDGETEYVLGRELYEPAHQNHNGGFYVYRTPAQPPAPMSQPTASCTPPIESCSRSTAPVTTASTTAASCHLAASPRCQ